MNTRWFTIISFVLSITLFVSFATTWSQPKTVLAQRNFQNGPNIDDVNQQIDLPAAPFLFIENVGQFDDELRFQVQGNNATIHITDNTIWTTVFEVPDNSRTLASQDLKVPTPTPEPSQDIVQANQPRQGVNLKYEFVGANPNPQLEPFNRLDTTVSYFVGSDAAQWQPNVPVWGGIRYKDLYPGVDLEMAVDEGQWSWRLIAKEQVALDAVRLRLEGMDKLEVDNSGRLRLNTAVGSFPGPEVTASIIGAMRTASVESEISLQAVSDGGGIKFVPTAKPDGSMKLTTQSNPGELVYSTLLGGSNFDAGNAIAAGSGGTAYLTGETFSVNFPTTPGAFDPTINGNGDIFVAKFYSAGNIPAFITFLGGSGYDQGYDLAVDASGSSYIVGTSRSYNFPTTTGSYDTNYNYQDVVVTKLSSTGNALLYSTYLGGSSGELGTGVAVNEDGAVYVTGETFSSNFPTTAGAFDTTWNGGNDAFVAKLNSSGTALEYGTFLGGSALDRGILQTDEIWTFSKD